MKTLADVFEHTLNDMYYAENALVKALPGVAKAASNAEFKKDVSQHLAETETHGKILQDVGKDIGTKPAAEARSRLG